MSTTLEFLLQKFAPASAISRTQLRDFLGISPSTEWRIIRTPRYPRVIKVGDHERVLLVDLAAFLDAGGASSVPKKRGRPVGSRNKTPHP